MIMIIIIIITIIIIIIIMPAASRNATIYQQGMRNLTLLHGCARVVTTHT